MVFVLKSDKMESKVSIIKCNEYDYKSITNCLNDSFNFFGEIKKLIKKSDKILIKPNICNALPPERADTTHPIFLKAVIDYIIKYNKNIVVGESSAGLDSSDTNRAFETSGIKKILEDSKIELRNLTKEPYEETKIPNGKVIKKTKISKAFFDFDMIINLPKLKTHNNTFLTGCVKNCFGFVQKTEREKIHKLDGPGQGLFSQSVVDIYSLIKTKIGFNIMDAIVGMEGIGTPAGTPKKIGVLLMGVDGVSVDAIASSIIGFKNPLEIPPTRFSHERNLGIGTLNKIKTNQKLNIFKLNNFELPLSYTKKNNTRLYPNFNKNRCIKCGLCEKSCPVNAIKIGKNIEFDKKKCISCFCCFESCENNAIELIEETLCKKKIKSINCKECIYYLRYDCKGV